MGIDLRSRREAPSDPTLQALDQALRQIGGTEPLPPQPDPVPSAPEVPPFRQDNDTAGSLATKLGLGGPDTPSLGALIRRGLIGAGVVAVTVLGILSWLSPGEKERAPTAATPPALIAESGRKDPAPAAHTATQVSAPPAAVAAVPAELTMSLQSITQALGSLQQGVEQLKASQARLARDQAELGARIMDTQAQLSQRTTGPSFGEERERLVRDYQNATAQLQASQERLAAVIDELKSRPAQQTRRPAAAPASVIPPIVEPLAAPAPARSARPKPASKPAATTAAGANSPKPKPVDPRR